MSSVGPSRAVTNIAGSIFVTGLTIAAIYACSHFVFRFPSPSPVLLIAVVFSAFVGGLPAGLLSAFLVIVFGGWFFADTAFSPFSRDVNRTRFLTLAVTAPLMAVLAGLLRDRARNAAAQVVHQQSDRRFREALVNAAVPIMMHTEDGEVLLINDEWTRLSGYTLADIPRLNDWLRLAHGDEADAIASGVKALFNLPQGAPERDFQIRTKAGEHRIWSATVSAPGTLSDGRRYVVVMARDTTDARRAADALAQQTRTLETINKTAALLTGELDLDRLVQKLTDAGRELSRAEFGAFFYNPQNERGESYMLHAPSGMSREKFGNSGIVGSIFTGGSVVRVDDVIKDPRYGAGAPHREMFEGELQVRSYLAVPVLSRSGEVIGGLFFGHRDVGAFDERSEQLIVGIAAQAGIAIDNARLFQSLQRELDERKRVEHALLEASERTRLAVLSANIGTFDWNIRTDELKWSDRCKAVFGLPTDAAISYQIFLSRLHPDDRPRVEEIVRNVLDPAGGGSFDAEYRAVWPDQSIHWITARGRCFFEGEQAARKAVRFIGTVLDITDIKEAELRVARAKEQAEAANRSKDRFLATLSHELRTPLTPVLLTAAARENDPDLSEDLRADLSLIRRNVELEARLIDDLLDLTRVSRGKLKLGIRPTDPTRAIRAAIEVCDDDIQSKRLRITMAMPSQPVVIAGDPARLQQIFWNLIKNAVKFTAPGGQIEVRCELQERFFVARVSDNGIGIDETILPRIFNAFEQGDEQTAKEFGGLGLGLAICKALVDMHGGELSAASEGKNRGATFSVTLPLATQGTLAPSAPLTVPPIHELVPPAATDAQPAAVKPLRILLVEDHHPTSRVLSMLLRQMSHVVTAAPTVAEALRHVETDKFDLLISDLGLPDGTGLDLMREIRRKHDLAGICLSGYGMDGDLIESREAGFVEHLIKPVDLPRLKSAIESAVS